MPRSILSLLALAGLSVAGGAQAADVTLNFSFSNAAASASGQLTYDTSKVDAVSGGFAVTKITGVFSDTALGLSNVAITGLVPAAGGLGKGAPFPDAFSLFPSPAESSRPASQKRPG
jgi:hypothetical protein